jgi:HSP20 family molecular chaperone IbpA
MDEFAMAEEPAALAAGPLGADSRSLLSLLGRLLIQIDPSGDAASSNGSANRPTDCWEDDAYIYFEAMLPDIRDRDVDVCLHDGKVNIRMQK